jgi:hypothetical protein
LSQSGKIEKGKIFSYNYFYIAATEAAKDVFFFASLAAASLLNRATWFSALDRKSIEKSRLSSGEKSRDRWGRAIRIGSING